jgi:cytochrome c oxidase subunit 1
MSTSVAAPRSSGLRELFGFNFFFGIVLAIVGFPIGSWLGNLFSGQVDVVLKDDQNDTAIALGFLFAVLGFLAGMGFFNYPVKRLLGRPPSLTEHEAGGAWRYFRLCTDHKVIGIQYLVGTLFFFFVAGLNAMFMRTELLFPTEHFLTPDQYLTVVGLHGTMMIMMSSAIIVGPFGNYFFPIMIGARRMAFPRLEALSFWLVPAAEVILLSALVLGGIPSGWTGYGSLSIQGKEGLDAYLASFALIGVALTLVGLNMLATLVTMRAPGMTWTRLPIFVWGVASTAILMLLAAPVLVVTMILVLMDRTMLTSFFEASAGGSTYLYQNLFWFFGHPEVYILALPGFAVVLEVLAVFCRKPIWGYKLAVTGMLGVTLLSFFVWQHHLFVSGINANLRPFYMLTTELISIPTGLVFLNGMGTLWRAKIRYAVPMLFALAFFFNFFIGGLSGVFLSDTPSDVTTHGSFFVMAHFHYTIMGGLIFAFFAGLFYWFPKVTGVQLNERLGKIQFWMFFVFFNLTFFPLFAAGFLGQPRRVSTYAVALQGINDWVSISAFFIGLSMLVFAANLVYSWVIARVPAEENPWQSRGIEWMLPTPIPVDNFETVPEILASPYEYGEPGALPVAVFQRPAATGSEGG